jgi:DNA-binding NarL/FixJ family response regulator
VATASPGLRERLAALGGTLPIHNASGGIRVAAVIPLAANDAHAGRGGRMKPVSILLVDDHPVVREGYRRLLERQPGFTVCAEAVDADSAYEAFCRHQPDVVVMDMLLPGASGLDALRHIRQRDADARVLVVTMHSGASMALKVLEAGAWGYVTKSSGPNELVRAVTAVAQGEQALCDDTRQAIATQRLADPIAVLDDLVRGRSRSCAWWPAATPAMPSPMH